MKTTTHTPGPWIASCDDEDAEEANVILAKGVVIATVEDAPEIRRRKNRGKIEGPGCAAGADALDEVDANARLMAAAPDLLEVVTLGLSLQKEGDIWSVQPNKMAEFLRKAQAAIAKANPTA
jgi:hypothetical protein